MTKHPQPQHGRPADRGERRSSPQTPAGKETTSRRTPEATPAEDRLMDEHEFKRRKELNPDDFE